MNKKTSIIAAGIALAAVTAVGASSVTPAAVRPDLKLKAPTERILIHQVKGSEIDYDYVSDEEATDQYYFAEGSHYSGAKIVKKTLLTVAGKKFEQAELLFNGDQVFKDDSTHKILRIHQHATTSIDAWDQQTKKTLLQRFISFLAPPNVYATTDTYTSSTSWIAPTGVTSVKAEVWAGGGAGGGVGDGGNRSVSGGGGGGGAYSVANAVVVSPGNSYTVTVGGGGSGVGGSQGNAGGDSWFSSTGTVLAKGGNGGQSVNEAQPPNAGTGGAAASGVGDTKFSGANGGNGSFVNGGTAAQSSASGGGGAGSAAGGTAGANALTGTNSAQAGGAGGSPDGGTGGTGCGLAAGSNGVCGGGNGNTLGGGGAAGVMTRLGAGNVPGGNGARGQVSLTYTSVTPALDNNEFFWYSNEGL